MLKDHTPPTPELFEHYAATVRDRLMSMGLSALKDPEFMRLWLLMKQHAPAGFSDDAALRWLEQGPQEWTGDKTDSIGALAHSIADGADGLPAHRILH